MNKKKYGFFHGCKETKIWGGLDIKLLDTLFWGNLSIELEKYGLKC